MDSLLIIFGILLVLYLIKKVLGAPGEFLVGIIGWIAAILIITILILFGLRAGLRKMSLFDPNFNEPLSFIERLIDNFMPKKNPTSANSDKVDSSGDSSDSSNSENSDGISDGINETSSEDLSEIEEKLKKDISEILSKEFEKKDSVILNRNFATYLYDWGANKDDLKKGKYKDPKDFEKDFFSAYSKKVEYNHITSAEPVYSNIDYTLKLKEKNGKKIFSIKFNNAKKFNCKFKQIEDKFIYGRIDHNKKDSIFQSAKDLFDSFLESKISQEFGEHSNIEAIEVNNFLEKLGTTAVVSEKELQIIKALATNKCFDDIDTVKLNDIYLKKDGIVKSNFSSEDITSVFGSTKKEKEKTTIKKVTDKKYVVITSTFCSSSSAIELIQIAKNLSLDGLIYSSVNDEARARAQNGKTYFQLFEQIKNKDS